MGFKRLEDQDIVRSIDSTTSVVWSANTVKLSTFYTSSVQLASNSGKYYNSVYQEIYTSASAAVQFSVAYCDIKGSGSVLYNSLVDGYSPTRTNYGQYRTLVLGDEYGNFMFGSYTGSYFYALPLERARYKEKLMPGTMILGLLGSEDKGITLTDNSLLQATQIFKDVGRKYELISGSSGTAYTGLQDNGYTPGSGSYGWLLPDVGLILLNGAALDGTNAQGGIGLGTLRNSNTADGNPQLLIDSLNSSSVGFTINNEETLTSNYIFVRARNGDFNYSENPSFISGSTGEIVHNAFIYNPKTYITTVGLYNDNQDLLAVAKLSRPLLKDFTKELLLRVKLSFIFILGVSGGMLNWFS